MAAVLDIVVFGQRWDHRRAAFDLSDSSENDFGPAVVGLDAASDLDGAADQTAYVPNIFQIVSEDNDREWTRHLVFTEVEEVNSFGADFHPHHFAGYAFGFSDVLPSFIGGNAVGRKQASGETAGERNCDQAMPIDVEHAPNSRNENWARL